MSTSITRQQALKNISRNIQSHLKTRGWSKADLSRATGDSQMRLGGIVRGSHMPAIDCADRIAKAFGITIDVLVSKPARRRAS